MYARDPTPRQASNLVQGCKQVRVEDFFTLDYVAPIPIGHRVELAEFHELKTDRKGRTTEQAIRGYWIKDLDTGIEYGMDRHYIAQGFAKYNQAEEYPIQIRADLTSVRIVAGKVTVRRVLTQRSSQDWQIQTRIAIQPSK